MKKRSFSDANTLVKYGVALTNAESNPEISNYIKRFGYDSEKISEGKSILAHSQSVYDLCLDKRDMVSQASQEFDKKRKELGKMYDLHKKIAKVLFGEDPELIKKLAINIKTPYNFGGWQEVVSKFYKVISSSEELKEQLMKMNLSAEEVSKAQTLLEEMKAVHAVYVNCKGESQNATKLKNAELVRIQRWMYVFYKMARIALKDQPQLLESLYKVVKD